MEIYRVTEGWSGYIVGISACVGTDCSKTHILEADLLDLQKRGKITDYIGPNPSVWDNVVELGFLVNTDSLNVVADLIRLGVISYKQQDVVAWEAPIQKLATEDVVNGTVLDNMVTSIEDPIIISKKDIEF